MRCRKCNQELEEGLPFCPACGTDNSVAEDIAPEKPKKQIWKPIVAVACVLVLVAGIVAVCMSMLFVGESGGVTSVASYSKADDIVLANADVVVAKAGDLELTNGELQVIYWSMVYDFLDYYGDYVYYYGLLDYTKSLSEQYYNEDEGVTWQHYFLDLALQSWRRYEVLCLKAEEAGEKMSQSLETYLDSLYDSIEAELGTYGFDSVEAMIQYDFGAAATYERYLDYMKIYHFGNEYYGTLYDALEYTDDEIEAYYAVNEEDLTSAGYSKEDGNMYSVRHILVNVGDGDTTVDHTDAEWADCYAEAERILNEWLAGDATEESFAELAVTYSEDTGSSANGGLYSGLTASTNFVENFKNWYLDENRQEGDYGIVQSNYGYHIMYFCSSEVMWYEASKYYLASEDMAELLNTQEADYPLEVAYSKIMLAEVELG